MLLLTMNYLYRGNALNKQSTDFVNENFEAIQNLTLNDNGIPMRTIIYCTLFHLISTRQTNMKNSTSSYIKIKYIERKLERRLLKIPKTLYDLKSKSLEI